MFWKALAYSIKVWTTSVLVSPICYFIINIYQEPDRHYLTADSIGGGVVWYLVFIILETIFSSVTWVVFTVIIWIALETVTAEVWLKSITFLSGMFLTIAIFAVILPIDLTHPDEIFSTMMWCNAATIGWDCWFYQLKA